MSLTDYEVKDGAIEREGMSGVDGTVMTGTAAQNKARFDNLVKTVVAGSVNGLIAALMEADAAKELGFAAPEGMTASNLQEAVEELLQNTELLWQRKIDKLGDGAEGYFAVFAEDGSVRNGNWSEKTLGDNLEQLEASLNKLDDRAASKVAPGNAGYFAVFTEEGDVAKGEHSEDEVWQAANRQEVFFVDYGSLDASGITNARRNGCAVFCRKAENGIDGDVRYYPLIRVTEETDAPIGRYVFENGKEHITYTPYDGDGETLNRWEIEEIPEEVFIAEYGKTTWAEVQAAWDAGKVLFCRLGDRGYLVPMYLKKEETMSFSIANNKNILKLTIDNGDAWTSANQKYEVVHSHADYEQMLADLERRLQRLEKDAEFITFSWQYNSSDGTGIDVTAEKGMTWAEFVASKYNPTDASGNKIFSIRNGYAKGIYWYEDADAEDGGPYIGAVYTWSHPETDEPYAFKADDVIMDGFAYGWDE